MTQERAQKILRNVQKVPFYTHEGFFAETFESSVVVFEYITPGHVKRLLYGFFDKALN